jgi:predicted ATPase/DNA-binding SARP family transcriptional activator/Flp pilus assembly protein TadD
MLQAGLAREKREKRDDGMSVNLEVPVGPAAPAAPFGLEIRLFGTFEVRVRGHALPPLRYRKELWLLALLALRHDKEVTREWLAATFWPDNDQSKALFYLRKALSNLRNALGEEADRLQSPTTRTVRLDLTDAFADVSVFDTILAHPTDPPGQEERLQEAVALYRGPLLQDCPDEWVLPERQHREQAYLTTLEHLASLDIARGESAAAVRWLRLVLATEPYRESAACSLMQALADSGDRAALGQVYQDLRQRLRQDLNTSPAPETEALHKRLSQRQTQAQTLPPTAVSGVPATPTLRHLPVPLTDLIGRSREIGDVSGWLERRRLVTLLGPGGVGKTRLSIAVAEAALPRFPDGVWFVDLAPLTEAAYVPDAVGKVLGILQEAGQSATERLINALSTCSLLLVLDNCEHLLDACAALSERLLSSCPGLRILTTSRQALGVTGEQVYSVPSLALPALRDVEPYSGLLSVEKNPASLMDYAGIQLFVQRAVLVNPAFRLERRNAQAVAQICHHLDGIPLAIEMAAARVRSLSVEAIHGKLDQRFRLLTGGSRAALPRQQTLRALIDWSYDLLSDDEKTVLCRLSVFSGGWTLPGAESVCAGESVAEGELLDLLTGLVDKSLVIAETANASASVRYRLLETIKQYSGDRLRERGEEDDTRQRHLAYFVALAEKADPELRGPEQQRWLELLDADHDNLRSALQESGEQQLRLAAALSRFWMFRGYFTEGKARCDSLLNHHAGMPPSPTHARVFQTAGNMALVQGDYIEARRCYGQAIDMRNYLGDRAGEAAARANLATVSQQEGDFVSARREIEQCLAIQQELGDVGPITVSVTCLGNILRQMGEHEAAQPRLKEAVRLNRELGDRASEANALNLLGISYYEVGDLAEARLACQQALTINQELGILWEAGHNLNNLGQIARREGDLEEAEFLYAESLTLSFAAGSPRGIANCFNNWAQMEALRGRFVRAACLLGTTVKSLTTITMATVERQDVDELTALLRAELGEAVFETEFERGWNLTLEQAVAMATQNTQF